MNKSPLVRYNYSSDPLVTFESAIMNEMLLYLSANPSRGYDFTSGNESKLEDWVKNQPDNSIDPLILYRESLQLNDGNIWNALLTNYQLLRNYARWHDYPRYQFRSSYEEAHKFFNKFIDIRGNLLELNTHGFWGLGGDHPGSWYRIWGALLYRALFTGAGPIMSKNKNSTQPLSNRLTMRAKDLETDSAYFLDEILLKGPSLLGGGEPETDWGKFGLDKRASNAMNWMMTELTYPGLATKNGINLNDCMDRKYLIRGQ